MNRLLVDVTPASGGHGARGIGRYVRGLVEALAAAPVAGRDGIELLVAGELAVPPGYRVVRPLPLHGWRAQDVGWLTRWVSDSISVSRSSSTDVHATDPQAPLVAVGARRRIVTAYDLIPLEPDLRRSTRRHRRVVFDLYLRALRTAHRVIAISSTTAREIAERLDVGPERIDVVYPVVAPPIAAYARAPATEPTFLFVGVPDEHKRPALAVAALAEFRRRHGAGRLRMIGPHAKTHAVKIRAICRSHGVEGAVTVEGSLPQKALEQAFATSTALLAVSRIEGFGLPPVEAVLRDVPVVATDTPIARETLGSSATFVPADPVALAAAMATSTPPSAEARDELQRRYSATAVSRALLRTYDAVRWG